MVSRDSLRPGQFGGFSSHVGLLESNEKIDILSGISPTTGWWFGTMDFYDLLYIGNVIIPTDELIFFRGVGIPPTRLIL
jgi:hypothetical protein